MSDTIELDPAAQQWFAAYLAAKQRLEQAEEEMQRCRQQLEAAIGDAETATIDGAPVVYWKWTKGAVRIDTKALKEKEPEIADRFSVTGLPSRRFTLAETA